MAPLFNRDNSALQEVIVPAPEGNLNTLRRYNLERGQVYIVEGDQARYAFEIFKDFVTHGAEGLCITRLEPEKVGLEYGLERTPVLWLSRVGNTKNSLKPAPIENVAMAVGHFLEVGHDPVVLLDGLEYLVAHNKFPSVLSLLSDLVDKVAMHNAVMLIPLNPRAWGAQELSQVKRDVRVLAPAARAPASRRDRLPD